MSKITNKRLLKFRKRKEKKDKKTAQHNRKMKDELFEKVSF